MVVYTTTDKTVTARTNDFIRDAKLAVHGSTGAQLLNVTNKQTETFSVTVDNDIVNIIRGEGAEQYKTIMYTDSIQIDKEIELTLQYDDLTGSFLTGELVAVYQNGKRMISVTTSTKKQTKTLQPGVYDFLIYCGGDSSATNGAIRGLRLTVNPNSQWEPYTGGTPYTDKYTATIMNQSESEVTLSIENVSESVGESTELDVVLTDKNDITQRSEVGKTFTGGVQV